MQFKDGTYNGDIDDNVPHGYGTYVRHEGGSHEGQWVNGLPDGEGKVHYKGGEYYEGYFSQGRR